MIQIFDITQADEWDNIVRSFADYDVYYLSGYVKAYKIHGDGLPILVFVEQDGYRGICVYMKRDIANEKRLKNIHNHTYYDLITPYGYGGFLFEGEYNVDKLVKFQKELADYYKTHNIVCEFVRWHPMLQNANVMRGVVNIIDLGNTIHIDTSSKDIIWTNIISKNRNVIRSAAKKGVTIEHSKDKVLFKTFKEIYNQTMTKDAADEYYYFEDAFYDSIVDDLNDNYEMFYALLNGKIIAMSIMLFANSKMHYHLSGSLMEYRNNNPSNLLLYEAALWGEEQGFETFHLGGGLGSEEDNLFKFKQAFNRQSRNQFSISKIVYDESIYNKLVENRKENDISFDELSHFFPLYRS